MLCAVGTGRLDVLCSFNFSQSSSKFSSRDENLFCNWQFSRELPTPALACVLASKSSHTLGDGQIQLEVGAPLS